MKSFIKLSFIFFLLFSCNKINDKNQSSIYTRILGDNSWGYSDDKGNIIIPVGKYKFLNPIDNQGMILAQLGNKYGYIDINENIIVPFEYDDIGLFSEGLAFVKRNNKFGFVNRKGYLVIPIQFEDESNFNNSGLALVQKRGRFGFIDKQGKEIIPIIYQKAEEATIDDLVILCKNGKWAFYNKKGLQKTDFVFDEIIVTSRVLNNQNETTFWQNGLILVKKNGQTGYLNKDLKEIISFGKYHSGEGFNQKRLAIVSKNSLYGIINEFGKEIIKTEYDTIEHPVEYYNESDIFVGQKKSYFVLFDEKGNKVADKIKEFHFDGCQFQNEYKKIYQIKSLDGLSGVIDNKGNSMIPCIYEEIEDFHGDNNTVVKYKGKFGIIASNNNIVYPIDNDYIDSWKESDYYIISKKQKTGMLDKNLKLVLNFDYQDLSPCQYDNNNRFIAKQNDKYGVINKNGNIIIPFEYSEMSNWVEYGPGKNYHFVTKNNKKGLITKEGKDVITPIYESLFYHNAETIILSKNKKYGVVTLQNKVVIPFIYDMIYFDVFYSEKKDPVFYVKQNDVFSVINDKNEIIRTNVLKEEIKNKFLY